MVLSRLKQLQRRVTGRLARTFEESPLWISRSGAGKAHDGTLPAAIANALGLAIGLPFFNRRVRQYNTRRADPGLMQALGARAGWEADWAPVGDSLKLAGAISRPRSPDAPWLLYFPGNWGDQLLESQASLEQLRSDADLGLAMWAPCGFEASEGTPSMDAFCSDAALLHRRLIDTFSARAMHLVGFSMGALIASALAGTLARAGQPPASLSLLSFHPFGFAVRRNSSRWFAPWLLPEWYAPATEPESLLDPILVVHGSDDSLESVHDTRHFAASLGPRGRYLELVGASHQATIEAPGLRAVYELIASGDRVQVGTQTMRRS